MCELNYDEQKEFLKFITGAPRLPLGGTLIKLKDSKT